MTEREPTGSRALSRLTELVRELTQAPAAAELERGLEQVRARLSAQKPQPSSLKAWTRRAAVAAACASLAAVVALGLRARAPRPVAVSAVEGGQLLQNGYLSESGGQGIRLAFDEGSRFSLTPGGRGRLRFDSTAGVRLMLERGSASLQITPTPEPRWSVESGPFLVTVKGTDFTVGWDPTSERFDLSLRRGRVVVSGPLVGDGFVVRPGQRLSVSLPKAETVITEDRPAGSPSVITSPGAPAASTAAAVLSAEPARAAEMASPAAPAAPAAPPPRQWQSALANGEWDRIINEAERGGLEVTLEAASSNDLFALADAARYRRRVDLAQSALLAQRRRFPSSPRAAEAVFLLGRIAELRNGGRSAALERYDEYLSRAPNGTYAAEALGRKMTLVNEVGGPARAIAAEYLRRFPAGSYAGAARTLLSVGE